MKKSPRKENALDILLDGIGLTDPSDAIEMQEARGQKELAGSDVLPSQIRGTRNSPDGREALERAGVRFGDYVESDPLFRYVELPEGWEKRPTDHSLWTDLVDAEGRVRASIFYKAAFYDRDAFVNVIDVESDR